MLLSPSPVQGFCLRAALLLFLVSGVFAQNKNSDDWNTSGSNPGIYVIAVLFVGIVTCVFCFGLYRFNKQRGKIPPPTDLQEIRIPQPPTPYAMSGAGSAPGPYPYCPTANTPLPTYQLVDDRSEFPWQAGQSTPAPTGQGVTANMPTAPMYERPALEQPTNQPPMRLHLPHARPTSPPVTNSIVGPPPPLRRISATSPQAQMSNVAPIEPPPNYFESTGSDPPRSRSRSRSPMSRRPGNHSPSPERSVRPS